VGSRRRVHLVYQLATVARAGMSRGTFAFLIAVGMVTFFLGFCFAYIVGVY
jgi:hypothetical protein